MIRVLLVDDHAVLRAGLRLLLETQRDLKVVGETADAAGAVAECRRLTPDVVILDVGLSDRSGIEATPQILAAFPPARILVLTMHADAAYLRAALSAGALGFVVKRSADTDLLDAVRAVGAGRRFIDRSFDASSFKDVSVRGAKGERTQGPRSLKLLSRRERQVFELVAEGFTNREIAKRVSIGIKSVEKYRARSLEKLGLKTRAEAVRFALECGLLAPGKPSNSY